MRSTASGPYKKREERVRGARGIYLLGVLSWISLATNHIRSVIKLCIEGTAHLCQAAATRIDAAHSMPVVLCK